MKEKNMDRINNFPDPIIHHIFSFLDMKEVVQTSILSKKWRYLWTSTPHLNFYFRELDPFNELDPFTRSLQQQKYTNLLNQALLFHDTSSIHKFNLNSEIEIGPQGLNTWLDQVSRLHVQEIAVQSRFNASADLTRAMFTSELMKMRVCSYGGGEIEICLPSSMCSAVNIKCIDLFEIKFPIGDSEGEFVLSLSRLESLRLAFCNISHLRVLTISAPLLESLEFRERSYGGKCDVNLLSPNLQSLSYGGFFYGNHSFGNLLFLDKADIACAGYIEICLQHPVRVLYAIRHVKALIISTWLVKTVAGSPEILKILPGSFPNLSYMKLIESSTYDTSICAIANLLVRLPHIESLVWQREKRIWPHDDGIWPVEEMWPIEDRGDEYPRELSSIPCDFHSLKTVEIRDSVGFKNELRLIEILLERATNMKKINIITGPMGERMREFNKKVMSLPSASSDLCILFQRKFDQ